ncbi:MAG TPA: WGxxGxxG family protein, partial [Phormidium sp.]
TTGTTTAPDATTGTTTTPDATTTTPSDTTGTTPYSGVRSETRDSNSWGWLGLLGLIGLANLFRKSPEPVRQR